MCFLRSDLRFDLRSDFWVDLRSDFWVDLRFDLRLDFFLLLNFWSSFFMVSLGLLFPGKGNSTAARNLFL